MSLSKNRCARRKCLRFCCPYRELISFRVIWELIKGEMIYVKDLETIETVSVSSFIVIKLNFISSFSYDRYENQRSFPEIDCLHFCKTYSITLPSFTDITVACSIVFTKYSGTSTLSLGASPPPSLTPLSTGGMLIWNISLTIQLQHSELKMRGQTIHHSRHLRTCVHA